jgi:p70 ribosomal S6 kinase
MLVSHFCKFGTIASQIGCKVHIKTDIIRLYACEIITALEYIHSQGYTYQALTPKNILINEDGHIMLSNFQMAKSIINTNSRTPLKANMAYLPPEVVKGEPYKTESDWYTLGLVLYEMTTCQPYFFEEKFGKIEDKSLEDLIKNLLNSTPNKRLGYKQGAKKIKTHHFFWNMVINKDYIMPLPAPTDTDPQFVDLHVSDDEEIDKDSKIQDWSFISPI